MQRAASWEFSAKNSQIYNLILSFINRDPLKGAKYQYLVTIDGGEKSILVQH